MPTVTSSGEKLASYLAPVLGYTHAISETCSLIARHAKTYARIQEMWCSVEMSDRETARVERQEEILERRIRDLVADLPHSDDGPFGVEFSGDPRGYTVRLFCPEPSARLLRNSCTTHDNRRATGVA